MTDKDIAYKKVADLVERFSAQYTSYKKADYNEMLTRRDFIDPFFKALGWDMDNENGYAESYREVIHEVKTKIKEGKTERTQAPDYAFRLAGGKYLFFVEAKKPSVFIKDEIQPAYQLRRYGWSAKLAISIITDFEEFAVYDCTKKPKSSDKASVARVAYLTFKEYLEKFDFLWNTFSKEQVLKGSFDFFVKSDIHKKGTATVDAAFLQSLDNWRTCLASSINRNNKELDEDELNFVVQQTIDRIIFLRIAEDRNIEPYGMLKNCIAPALFKRERAVYTQLLELFKQANDKYNSGLFDFDKDSLSPNSIIDNKTLKTIIDELYYPESPYEFSVISVEILGSAYEQFLGKTITVDKAHRAKITEKLQVRKAGGVYYTPQYIVGYIVQNTIGKLVPLQDTVEGYRGISPKEVADLKIVDPACGSGSFLLGAYDYLLKWHLEYYRNHPVEAKKDKALTPTGTLATALKKQVLVNTIYGVDIDVNAVEVTKLSLLLKCMEGETEASIAHQMRLFNERALPTLDENIKSGNSLVDTDFYEEQLDFGEERKIKPFNWQRAFPNVFNRPVKKREEHLMTIAQKAKQHAEKALQYVSELEEKLSMAEDAPALYEIRGGFDVVIGNPPWVDIKGHLQELVRYYFNRFHTTENRINLYSIFIERGLSILSRNGIFGFVIPNSILYQSSYEKIRKHILSNFSIDNIVRLPDNVFQSVKAEAIILTISRNPVKTECILYERTDTISQITNSNCKERKLIDSKLWLKNESFVFDIFSNKKEVDILRKIEKNKTKLSSLCDFTLGLTPYDKYKGHTQKQIQERVFHSTTKKDKTFKPLLEGADVRRYSVIWSQKEYISYGNWLGAPRDRRFFTVPRILIRQIISGNPLRIYAGYTEEELYNTQSIFNIISKDENKLNTKYLLALLNSNLINFYHSHKYLDLSKNLFQKILIRNCKNFPIKTINNKNEEDVRKQNVIIQFVDKLLHLNQEIQHITLESKRQLVQGKIDYCENKINHLVYQLYELTDEEIKMVES